ncbi:MAG: biosynthetic-type acetolactate synthase large subunit [Rickettsiales bacterium]|nr:biosynthetic-type acetolactate synthase large subunit [Rickettsiales bacterium]
MSDSKNPAKLTGAEIIVKAFLNEGVDTIFGYPGGAILPFYDALFVQKKLRHILTRHEQAAAHAAEGYARSTGKVGVITVTSGPGATNAITGLTDAYLDSIPLVCISGQVATSLIGTDGFQEADITGLTRSCTKYNYLVKDVNELGYVIHEAFHIAASGRPGPVLIDIPKDVQNNHGIYHGKVEINRRSDQLKKQRLEIHHDAIKTAVDLLEKAEKPIFYTGGGVINSGEKASELLTKLVHETGYPITNTLMGLGGFPATDSHFIGMLGMHGTYEANMAMYECDVMINVGARFDDRVTGKVSGFSPKSKKIHIDIDDCSIDKIIKVDVPIVGDAASALELILEEWQRRKIGNRKKAIKSWWDQIKKWQAIDSLSYEKSDKIIKPAYALQRLNALTKDQTPFISTDVGQHQMWAAQYLQFNHPKKWLTSGGLGTMGYGVPAALGAQIANPDALVMCVSGDASFMMNMQELATIKQYSLPVKIIILNNRYMGMVRQWQELIYQKRESQSYMESMPDFVKLAESFGIKGMRCENPEDLDMKIMEMINHKGPVLFDCVIEKSENVFPMIPAGAAHNEILLGSQAKLYVQKDINAV